MKIIKHRGIFFFRYYHGIGVAVILLLALLVIIFCRWGGAGFRKNQEAVSWAMAGKIIVVDPGHGGVDPGVVSPGGLLEKEVNLAVARYLGELLRQSGAEVIFTRENDNSMVSGKRADLCARAQLAIDYQAATFISLHGNSFPLQPSQRGAQVFYNSANQGGKELALIVQEHLSAPPLESNRKALHHSSAYLLKNIPSPAIIIEMGFLSNPQEEKLLTTPEYQWQLAYAIFHGIVDYFAQEESPTQNQQPNINNTLGQ